MNVVALPGTCVPFGTCQRQCRAPVNIAKAMHSISPLRRQTSLQRTQCVAERTPTPQPQQPEHDATSSADVANAQPQLLQEAPTEPGQLPEAEPSEEVKALQRLVQTLFLSGLNFAIIFVVAFMLPSFLPKEQQESIGLANITIYSTVVAALVTGAWLTTRNKDEDSSS